MEGTNRRVRPKTVVERHTTMVHIQQWCTYNNGATWTCTAFTMKLGEEIIG